MVSYLLLCALVARDGLHMPLLMMMGNNMDCVQVHLLGFK